MTVYNMWLPVTDQDYSVVREGRGVPLQKFRFIDHINSVNIFTDNLQSIYRIVLSDINSVIPTSFAKVRVSHPLYHAPRHTRYAS